MVADALCIEQIAQRILPSGFQLHACRGEGAAQFGMVQLAVVYLLHQQFGKEGALLHQPL